MRIQIAERLKPFTHIPGTYFILPNSNLRIQIYPTKLFVHDLSNAEPKLINEITFDFGSPLKNFTAQQDLEKGYIRIWGQTEKDFVRYIISSDPKKPSFCNIRFEKKPNKLKCICKDSNQIHFSEEKSHPIQSQNFERLSLGNHKIQDFNRIIERCDMKEIFPHWFALGQFYQNTNKSNLKNSLLGICEETIARKAKVEIISSFINLFKTGFDCCLSPRRFDEDFNGFSSPPISETVSPFVLLSEGSKLIRSLFIQQKESQIEVLPLLPPEFHCGRLVQIACGTTGKCDIEWSKKTIRRMIFSANESTQIHLRFQNDISRFRLRTSDRDMGQVMSNNMSVDVEKGLRYYFDNFK